MIMLSTRLARRFVTAVIIASIAVSTGMAFASPRPPFSLSRRTSQRISILQLASVMDAASYGDNLLRNGDFESNQPEPWAGYHALFSMTSTAHSGSWALRVAPWSSGRGLYDIADYGDDGNPWGDVPGGIIAPQAGVYVATAWVRGVPNRQLRMCVNVHTSAGTNQTCSQDWGTDSWESLSVSADIGAAGAHIGLWIGEAYYQDGDFFALDDVSLVVANPRATTATPTSITSPFPTGAATATDIPTDSSRAATAISMPDVSPRATPMRVSTIGISTATDTGTATSGSPTTTPHISPPASSPTVGINPSPTVTDTALPLPLRTATSSPTATPTVRQTSTPVDGSGTVVSYATTTPFVGGTTPTATPTPTTAPALAPPDAGTNPTPSALHAAGATPAPTVTPTAGSPALVPVTVTPLVPATVAPVNGGPSPPVLYASPRVAVTLVPVRVPPRVAHPTAPRTPTSRLSHAGARRRQVTPSKKIYVRIDARFLPPQSGGILLVRIHYTARTRLRATMSYATGRPIVLIRDTDRSGLLTLRLRVPRQARGCARRGRDKVLLRVETITKAHWSGQSLILFAPQIGCAPVVQSTGSP